MIYILVIVATFLLNRRDQLSTEPAGQPHRAKQANSNGQENHLGLFMYQLLWLSKLEIQSYLFKAHQDPHCSGK